MKTEFMWHVVPLKGEEPGSPGCIFGSITYTAAILKISVLSLNL